jgi:hypothetical protein
MEGLCQYLNTNVKNVEREWKHSNTIEIHSKHAARFSQVVQKMEKSID